MNLNETKLKDINIISFNIQALDYTLGDMDDFIIKKAEIIKVVMERGKLRVVASDDLNEAQFYIKAENAKGRKVLQALLLSDKMVGMSLESFPNLELKYFKR